jgi:hypothetical protein
LIRSHSSSRKSCRSAMHPSKQRLVQASTEWLGHLENCQTGPSVAEKEPEEDPTGGPTPF